MTIGFHYHTSFKWEDNVIKVPGQIGVFLEELARHSNHLYLFLEQVHKDDAGDHDFALRPENITLVSLGNKSSFYKRLFWPWHKVGIVSSYSSRLDFLLLRAPSPMVPALFLRLHKAVPTGILLVGNYLNGISGLKQPVFRKIGIVMVLYLYNWIQLFILRRAKVFVNSKALYDTYARYTKHIVQVKTTTLRSDSFFRREDTCVGQEIRLLYSGRINFQKGLRELVEAVSLLAKKFNIVLDVVGWEDPGPYSCKEALLVQANELGVANRIRFHGKKRVGEELNYYYRNSDIFVLPTYHEGFPRSIWESMANSLPVVCTPVGGIPHELTNRVDVCFVDAKSVTSLAIGIEEIIVNGALRRTIMRNAYEKSALNTMESQTVFLLNEMKKLNGKG